MKGKSETMRERLAPRATGLGVVDHVVHGDEDGRLVAEDDHTKAIADKDHRNAQLVEQLGGRVVVGGEHGDLLAVPLHLDDGCRGGSHSILLATYGPGSPAGKEGRELYLRDTLRLPAKGPSPSAHAVFR